MKKKSNKKQLTGAKKKEKTIKERQDLLKRKLIEILEKSPNLGIALERIGINRSTLSRWRDNDPNFSIELLRATEMGIESTADSVEISLLNSAKNGDVSAQKLYLTNNHQRYMKDRQVTANDGSLSEERKREIDRCTEIWDEFDPDEDERDEDYLVKNPEGYTNKPSKDEVESDSVSEDETDPLIEDAR